MKLHEFLKSQMMSASDSLVQDFIKWLGELTKINYTFQSWLRLYLEFIERRRRRRNGSGK